MLAFLIAHDFPYLEIVNFYSKEEVLLILLFGKLIHLFFIIIEGTFQNEKYDSDLMGKKTSSIISFSFNSGQKKKKKRNL